MYLSQHRELQDLCPIPAGIKTMEKTEFYKLEHAETSIINATMDLRKN